MPFALLVINPAPEFNVNVPLFANTLEPISSTAGEITLTTIGFAVPESCVDELNVRVPELIKLRVLVPAPVTIVPPVCKKLLPTCKVAVPLAAAVVEKKFRVPKLLPAMIVTVPLTVRVPEVEAAVLLFRNNLLFALLFNRRLPPIVKEVVPVWSIES